MEYVGKKYALISIENVQKCLQNTFIFKATVFQHSAGLFG